MASSSFYNHPVTSSPPAESEVQECDYCREVIPAGERVEIDYGPFLVLPLRPGAACREHRPQLVRNCIDSPHLSAAARLRLAREAGIEPPHSLEAEAALRSNAARHHAGEVLAEFDHPDRVLVQGELVPVVSAAATEGGGNDPIEANIFKKLANKLHPSLSQTERVHQSNSTIVENLLKRVDHFGQSIATDAAQAEWDGDVAAVRQAINHQLAKLKVASLAAYYPGQFAERWQDNVRRAQRSAELGYVAKVQPRKTNDASFKTPKDRAKLNAQLGAELGKFIFATFSPDPQSGLDELAVARHQTDIMYAVVNARGVNGLRALERITEAVVKAA